MNKAMATTISATRQLTHSPNPLNVTNTMHCSTTSLKRCSNIRCSASLNGLPNRIMGAKPTLMHDAHVYATKQAKQTLGKSTNPLSITTLLRQATRQNGPLSCQQQPLKSKR